jgi:hypothetical protein
LVDADDVAPACEGLVTSEAIVGGGTLMALKVKPVGDWLMNGEKSLSLFGLFEPLQHPFASPGRQIVDKPLDPPFAIRERRC